MLCLAVAVSALLLSAPALSQSCAANATPTHSTLLFTGKVGLRVQAPGRFWRVLSVCWKAPFVVEGANPSGPWITVSLRPEAVRSGRPEPGAISTDLGSRGELQYTESPWHSISLWPAVRPVLQSRRAWVVLSHGTAPIDMHLSSLQRAATLYSLGSGEFTWQAPPTEFLISANTVEVCHNCDMCSEDTAECLSCLTGYGWNSNKTCTRCPRNTFSYGGNEQCEVGKDHCLVSAHTSPACVQCEEGAGLYDGECVPCTNGTYSLGTTPCHVCSLHCAACSTESNCTACESPFVLDDTRCVTAGALGRSNSTLTTALVVGLCGAVSVVLVAAAAVGAIVYAIKKRQARFRDSRMDSVLTVIEPHVKTVDPNAPQTDLMSLDARSLNNVQEAMMIMAIDTVGVASATMPTDPAVKCAGVSEPALLALGFRAWPSDPAQRGSL
eukprot:m51a1_g7458 putative protein serine threonine (440) ;mRNA; f:137724-140726